MLTTVLRWKGRNKKTDFLFPVKKPRFGSTLTSRPSHLLRRSHQSMNMMVRTNKVVPYVAVPVSAPIVGCVPAMVLINKSQVPTYLHKSAFYQALDSIDHENFEVPSHCFKTELIIQSDQDLCHLLHTVRFWSLFPVPEEVYHFVMNTAECTPTDPLFDELPEFKDRLENLATLRGSAPNMIVKLAIERGLTISVVRFLHASRGYVLSTDCWAAVAKRDDIPLMLYLVQQKIPCRIPPINMIASEGGIRCLKYAHGHRWPIREAALNIAARAGHFRCVKFIHTKCKIACTKETLWCACSSHSLDIIRYVRGTGCAWTEETTMEFARSNQLECLMYAHQNGCPWHPQTCQEAARGGHLSCLVYARTHGCPWAGTVCNLAATHGHLLCLKYAHEQGCPWSLSVCANAAEHGHLSCLEYAHSHGCPWDASIVEKAYENGHSECLRYAFEHNCPKLWPWIIDPSKLIASLCLALFIFAFLERASWALLVFLLLCHLCALIDACRYRLLRHLRVSGQTQQTMMCLCCCMGVLFLIVLVILLIVDRAAGTDIVD